MSSWLQSFPILRLQSRSLCSVFGHPRTLKLRSWMVHAFTVSVWPWQRSNRASPSSRGWEGLFLSLPSPASLPQAENHRLVLWAIWGLQWEPFRLASPRGHLTPLAAAVLCGSLVILLLRLTTCPAFHSACPIEDQILIAASVVWLLSSEDEYLAGLPPSGVVATAKSDSWSHCEHPPGRREHRVGGVHTSQSRALTVGRLVPRLGPLLTTMPCLVFFLPRGAWGADEVMDGTFFWTVAARLPPPSSLPSMAGRLGGTLKFPRWRVRLRCTCACKTPLLRGIVLVCHPKAVSWWRLSLPKLTVLWAEPPLPCMPWLSCSTPSQGIQTNARG